MAEVLTTEPSATGARELQTLIDYYLAEMKVLSGQMARDQERIDSLKAETSLIAGETQAAMEGLQTTLAQLRSA